MRVRTLVAVLIGVNLALLVAGAYWLRTFSLASIPLHQADEAFYGIQTARLLRGESFAWRTTSGNVTSPLYLLSQAPILLLGGPTIWAIRLPAAISGLATVALVFRLARRRLDRETAMLAAALVLTMPASIRFSRFGCEFSQTPMVGALAFALAMAGRGRWLFGLLWLGLLVHPTNIFLLPMVGPVFVAQAVRRDPGRWRRSVLICGLAAGSIALPFLVWALGNPNVQGHSDAPRDWPAFVDAFGRFVAHFSTESPAGGAASAYRWAFRLGMAALVAAGGAALWRRRQWERLAVVGGLAAGLAAFHVAAGSAVLDDFATKRYGAVLIVPWALAVAVLAEAVLPRAASGRGLARQVGLLAVLVAPWLLLASTREHVFGPDLARPGESLARLVSEDPYQEAADVILRNVDRTGGPSPRVVIAQDLHLNGQQLEFLTSRRRDVRVVPWFTLYEVWVMRQDPGGGPLAPRVEKLVEAMRGGAYAATSPGSAPDRGGGSIEAAIASRFPPDRVARWENAAVGVFRLRDPEPPAGRLADGRDMPTR